MKTKLENQPTAFTEKWVPFERTRDNRKKKRTRPVRAQRPMPGGGKGKEKKQRAGDLQQKNEGEKSVAMRLTVKSRPMVGGPR